MTSVALLTSDGRSGVVAGDLVCRLCGAPLEVDVVDLGLSPLCESFLTESQLGAAEPFYPLHVKVCTTCWLAQLPAYVQPAEIFTEYAYFSGYSSSWLEHAQRYVEDIVQRLRLDEESLVVEIASNDGYLLQHFVSRGIPVLGIDPARNVARQANVRGVPTLVEFFDSALARRLVEDGIRPGLVIGNNVLAQVPDLPDFIAGVALLLADDGTATFEFPHLARLLGDLEYDTIYHEHFSYFSLFTIREAFARSGLAVVDVDEIATHGGSLRVSVKHEGAQASPAVAALLERERAEGLTDPRTYRDFGEQVRRSKAELLDLLLGLRREGKRIAGYGAPGKGTTLLNYCGIGPDLIEYTVDRNPYKHGRFTPGTHIPIHPPEHIDETRPDVIVVLPWNLAPEISRQLAYTAEWGARLLLPIPHPRLVEPGV